MSAIGRKAIGDLARHRVRAALTACTFALALSSLAVAAVPGLMDRVMDQQVRAARLYDVAVSTRDLVLSRAQLSALGRLPDVSGFAASIEYPAEVTADGQRQDATIWGIGLESQSVDAIGVLTGSPPKPGELLADAGNPATAGMTTPVGDLVAVRTASGAQARLRVSGLAHGLATSPSANNGSGGPVFYASEATVRSLARVRGVNYLAFRLVDDSTGAQAVAIAAIHGYLKSQTGTEPFVALPATRAQGDWPGRAGFDQVISLLYTITVLAIVSALFLIVTTMNTLVAEQAAEIAILKTLGGRRRQIGGIVLRAAVLLGGMGAIGGAVLGIALAYVLTSYFAASFYDVRAGFAISVPVVAASLVLGPALAALASLPGLRRALRRPVAQALADRGTGGYGTGGYGAARLDRLVARSRLLPGPVRMGVRNVLRAKRRSAATVAQVAVATGLAIALLAGGQSVAAFVGQGYSNFRYAIEVDASSGSALDSRAGSIAAGTPGVTGVEPLVESQVTWRGTGFPAWGLPAHPLYAYRLSAGRWFTAADGRAGVPPVVLGPSAARAMGARVGQVLTFGTAGGPGRFRVIGIDTGEDNVGRDVFCPLDALRHLSGLGAAVNALWLTTASARPASVDWVTTLVQDRLTAAGYAVSSQERYVQEASVQAQDNAFVAIIEILGLLVVAITLIGLVNALTMSVIERTGEIGVLRCLGARARQVRRVFGAEGLVLATAGWALGVPLAVLIARLLLLALGHDIDVALPMVFPAVSVPVALAVMVAITWLAIRPPLRRATRIKPAQALRYQSSLVAAMAVLVLACGGGPGSVVSGGVVPGGVVPGGAPSSGGLRIPGGSGGSPPWASTVVLHWRPCHHGFQCATARVPLDYRHPRGKLISIAVIMHRASAPARRAGVLFVNGGGPLEQIVPFIAAFPAVPAVLRQRFDIVTFDPRGFGFSAQVRCFPSIAAEDRLLAPVLPFPLFPVGARQTAAFERTYARFDAACARRAGVLLDHDSTADEARDMDLLRQAVGARRLNYIGLSYGTGLGAVYANLFPSKVGHMVLDGNLNPVAWTHASSLPTFARLQQGRSAVAAMRVFLDRCGGQPVVRCAFSAGTPAATVGKFATLRRRLRAGPVSVGGQRVTYAEAFMIIPPGDVSEWHPAAVQLQQLWVASGQRSAPSRRLAGAGLAGTGLAGTGLAGTGLAGVPYSGIEQSFAVLCADSPNPRSSNAYVAAAQSQSVRYGGFGALAVWTSQACAAWPRAAGQDRYSGPWNRRTASTILVIGNTGDPVTGYRESVAMARDLGRARLLTVDGFGHTEFFNRSACASHYEFRYLITGALPPPGTVCQQTVKPF